MTRLCLPLLAAAAVTVSASPHAMSEDRTSGFTGTGQETPASSQWYFLGNVNHAETVADINESAGFGYLDDPTVDTTRVELGLTFSNSRDMDRISFSNGQAVDLESGSDSYTFLVSGAYDLDTGTPFTPHFMAGLGLRYSDLPADQISLTESEEDVDSRLKPAMQLGMGASYIFNDSLSLTARYRALYLSAQIFNTPVSDEGNISHDFMVGARIRF